MIWKMDMKMEIVQKYGCIYKYGIGRTANQPLYRYVGLLVIFTL